jgi:hypothetical protein
MRAPLILRLSGWGVSLAGGLMVVLSGGFGDDIRNPLPWIGTVVFFVGMILTSISGLVAHLHKMRRLKEEIKEAEAVRRGEPGKPE